MSKFETVSIWLKYVLLYTYMYNETEWVTLRATSFKEFNVKSM